MRKSIFTILAVALVVTSLILLVTSYSFAFVKRQAYFDVSIPKNVSLKFENSNQHKSIYHFHLSRCSPKYGTVAILQLASGDNYINGEAFNALQSMRCYSKMRGYDLYQLDTSGKPINKLENMALVNDIFLKCEKYKSTLSKRHCLAAHMLSSYNYVIHIDADSGVVNPDHCFEEYIHPGVDMHFLLRIHTGEIQAGHYIMKNSEYSKRFLMDWANQTGGNDQPLVHMKLSNLNLPTKNHKECLVFYQKNYWKWIYCIVSALRATKSTNQKHLLIYSRGQTFVRDGWANNFRWSDNDFMFHAMKRQDDVVFKRKLRQEDCENDVWVIPSKKELYIDSIPKMKDIWKKFEEQYFPSKQFGIEKGIDHCWPNCPHIVV